MPYNPEVVINTGSYVQQTPLFNIQQLERSEVGSPEFKRLIVELFQQVNTISIVLNNKISGFYVTQEFLTGAFLENLLVPVDPSQQRQVFNITIFTGTINTGVNVYAHGLTVATTWSFIKILGAANDNTGFNYYPLPFSSAAGATNIEVKVDNTNVTVTNNSGITFNSGYIFLEYVKY